MKCRLVFSLCVCCSSWVCIDVWAYGWMCAGRPSCVYDASTMRPIRLSLPLSISLSRLGKYVCCPCPSLPLSLSPSLYRSSLTPSFPSIIFGLTCPLTNSSQGSTVCVFVYICWRSTCRCLGSWRERVCLWIYELW